MLIARAFIVCSLLVPTSVTYSGQSPEPSKADKTRSTRPVDGSLKGLLSQLKNERQGVRSTRYQQLCWKELKKSPKRFMQVYREVVADHYEGFVDLFVDEVQDIAWPDVLAVVRSLQKESDLHDDMVKLAKDIESKAEQMKNQMEEK